MNQIRAINEASTKEFLRHAAIALSKRVPFLGDLIEAYLSCREAIELELLKDFVERINLLVIDQERRWDEEWLITADGKKYCTKVVSSAMNAEYCDKIELFSNAYVNGTVISDLKACEKFKFVDIIRHLSRPALDVLAFMNQVKQHVGGKSTMQLTEFIINSEQGKKRLVGMDFYLIYSCIVEIKQTGLMSSATQIHKDRADGPWRVLGSYSAGVETYTSYTEKFINFVKCEHLKD